MAEEEAFDPTMMKKKSKSKKPLDLSALESEVSGAAAAQSNEPDLDPELAEISELLMKKKKKKKATFNLDDLESALPDAGGASAAAGGAGEDDKENNQGEDGAGSSSAATKDLNDDLDFDLSKKKKKKKKINFEELAEQEAADLAAESAAASGAGREGADGIEFDASAPGGGNAAAGIYANMPWLETDRDYTYEDLINRVYGIIREKNPDIVGDKKRLVMRPPQVLRVGTKKTSFANFLDICKSLHRQPKHMQSFLLAELGTSGSVDANNTLIIKGRFQQKQIENVLRRYIKEYVACQTCRSPETILQKDTRLFFLQCETCGSRRSVASIKSGFQALTSKRAAIRAKGV